MEAAVAGVHREMYGVGICFELRTGSRVWVNFLDIERRDIKLHML